MIARSFHVNGKVVWHRLHVSEGNVMFKALDFVKLICRLVRVLKVLESLSRFRSVVSGSVRKRRMSSAKAASL